MLKVLTLVGTRPEIIKLSRVIAELDSNLKNILVHTGQNYDYELNEIFFREMQIRKPDYFLDAVGDNLAQTIANIIVKTDQILEIEQPDAVLILGDTNSCLGVMSAKRRKIPIFHMEAGNRCFDLRVPEEINRKIVDHLSDVNLTYTEHARKYLLSEGMPPDLIIKTGSPMLEVIQYYSSGINASDILLKLNLKSNNYFVFSAHREENVDNKQNLNELINTLNKLAEKYSLPIIVSTHPRIKKRLTELGEISFNDKINFISPLGFLDYIQLQKNSCAVISDSGTITEEASILNIPAVTIRNQHERPEGMDEGTLIMAGIKAESVISAVEIVLSHNSSSKRCFSIVQDYNADNVSKKVLRIIMSYTDYVNRNVWKKF